MNHFNLSSSQVMEICLIKNPVACSTILGKGREKWRRQKKAPDSTKKQKVGRERVSSEGPGGFVEEGTNRHIQFTQI